MLVPQNVFTRFGCRQTECFVCMCVFFVHAYFAHKESPAVSNVNWLMPYLLQEVAVRRNVHTPKNLPSVYVFLLVLMFRSAEYMALITKANIITHHKIMHNDSVEALTHMFRRSPKEYGRLCRVRNVYANSSKPGFRDLCESCSKITADEVHETNTPV